MNVTEITIDKLVFELIQKFSKNPPNYYFKRSDFRELTKKEPRFFSDGKNRYDAINTIEVYLWKSNYDRRPLVLEPALECTQAMYVNFKHRNPNNTEFNEKRFCEIIELVNEMLDKEPKQGEFIEPGNVLLEITILLDSWLTMFLQNKYVPTNKTVNLQSSKEKDIAFSLMEEFDEALEKQGYHPNEYFIHNALSRAGVCFLERTHYGSVGYLLDYIKRTMENNLNGSLVV